MSFDELVKSIMADYEKDGEPISKEEAEEVARMEIGAKEVKNVARAVEPGQKEKKPKVIKVSDEKTMLFNQILDNLNTIYGENVEILKENKLICVKIGEKILKIDIIEQRPAKK